MIKKIISLAVSAALLVVACVIGFVYSGMDATIPTVESKVKIEEPEETLKYLNLPSAEDYLYGRVESGKADGAFDTISIYSSDTRTYSVGSDNSGARKGTATVYYGSDAIQVSASIFQTSRSKEDTDGGSYTVLTDTNIEGDVYITENTCFVRIRKYETNKSVSPAREEDNKQTLALKKCLQSHLNQWFIVPIGVEDTYHSGEEPDLDEEYKQQCDVVAWQIFSLLIGDSLNNADTIEGMVNDYINNRSAWTRSGSLFNKTQPEEGERKSVCSIDLSGNAPCFEYVDEYRSTGDSSSAVTSAVTNYYTLFGITDTKTVKPKEFTDAYSVLGDYVRSMMEDRENE